MPRARGRKISSRVEAEAIRRPYAILSLLILLRGGGADAAALDALRNPLRRRILKIVQERPGIQPFHVWQEVGGAISATMRALAQLEDLGLVRALRRGKHKHFYENSPQYQGANAEVLASLATRTIGDTYAALRRLGPSTQKELAAHLGLSASTVSDRLARLEHLGLVVATRDAPSRRYAPVDLGVPSSIWDHREVRRAARRADADSRP